MSNGRTKKPQQPFTRLGRRVLKDLETGAVNIANLAEKGMRNLWKDPEKAVTSLIDNPKQVAKSLTGKGLMLALGSLASMGEYGAELTGILLDCGAKQLGEKTHFAARFRKRAAAKSQAVFDNAARFLVKRGWGK